MIAFRLATGKQWPPADDKAIAALFDFANRQYLLPLLMSDDALPSAIAEAKSGFRALESLYRKRFELSRIAALELRNVLGADTFLFYKGADYRHRLYPRPELRVMADTDIHIPAAGFTVALQRLAAAGYTQKYSAFGDTFAPGYHEVKVEIGSVQVELHRSFGQRVRAGIDYEGMWRRREWFDRDGIGGYRLSPEDAILCHAFNLAKDEFSTEFNRYVDFYLLLQQHEDQLAKCVAHAKAWGIERALFGALHITSSLFSQARTGAVCRACESLLDVSKRRFLVDRVLPDPATEPSGHVTGRHAQLWRKFMLMDRRWRRVAFVGYHAYATAIGSALGWRARRDRRFNSSRSTEVSR